MKTITFTVEIQADFNDRDLNKRSKTLRLCREINEILARYDGAIGGAQIISRPKVIKVMRLPEDLPT